MSAEDDDAAIRIDRLVVRYRGKTAVNGLSLAVPPGAVCALLGDNGAGKSTTMKVLTGLVAPHAGKAEILGYDCWSRVYELRHRVGYVPERPRFYDWMRVRETGWFTASFHRRGFQARFDEWADKLGLDQSKRLKELSKGGYARVGLALALAADPQVLLLDEPTSGLDLLTRREFLSCLVELAAEGRTILVSSHSIAELERFASHAAFMKDGKVFLHEPLDDLRKMFRRVEFRTSDLRPDLSVLGTVLSVTRAGKFTQAIVQNPNAAEIDRLRHSQTVTDFEESAVGLEEVYAALMAKPDKERKPSPVRQRTEDEFEGELQDEGV